MNGQAGDTISRSAIAEVGEVGHLAGDPGAGRQALEGRDDPLEGRNRVSTIC